jgi:hypothetical protein
MELNRMEVWHVLPQGVLIGITCVPAQKFGELAIAKHWTGQWSLVMPKT